MDCRTARLLLEFARPLATELDEGDGEALASHMVECSACASIQGTERKLDESIGRAMRDVPVPPELRSRLVQRLAAQRDLWYRRRIVWPAVAAAAAVLLAWLGIHVVDPADRTQPGPFSGRNQLGPNARPGRGPVAQRHDGKGPPGFDAGLLDSHRAGGFSGQAGALAGISPRCGPGLGVCPPRPRLQSQGEDEPAQGPSGRYAIAVLKNPDEPHIAYVIIYTGPDLSPFMQTARPAT